MGDVAKTGELAPAQVVPPTGGGVPAEGGEPTVQVKVSPTQVRRPWKATVRTVFQMVVGLATLLPLVVTNVYDSPDAYPAAVVQVLAVAAVITRVMAMPQVERFLQRSFPWLAAAPSAHSELQGRRRGA